MTIKMAENLTASHLGAYMPAVEKMNRRPLKYLPIPMAKPAQAEALLTLARMQAREAK